MEIEHARLAVHGGRTAEQQRKAPRRDQNQIAVICMWMAPLMRFHCNDHPKANRCRERALSTTLYAVQQTQTLFNHLVGEREQRRERLAIGPRRMLMQSAPHSRESSPPPKRPRADLRLRLAFRFLAVSWPRPQRD
jgi:hypothetical protein